MARPWYLPSNKLVYMVMEVYNMATMLMMVIIMRSIIQLTIRGLTLKQQMALAFCHLDYKLLLLLTGFAVGLCHPLRCATPVRQEKSKGT